ncbi:chromate efflux transporter [Gaiella sp.]|uniref:chromate efflux transporter n=1 Tax=Gaiella sp. TaxID=2663207 RepID=UPI00398338F7
MAANDPPDEIGSTTLPTESEALRFWLRLGMISFGGPAGQVAIMHDELVEKRGWISERRFLHALNFCMALPGPEAQQLASYIGYSMYGVRGAMTAGGLFVLPSFVLLCLMSAVYVEYGEVAAVEGVVRGLGAAVIALVAAAVIRVGQRVIRTPPALAMALIAFALLIVGVPFLAIIATAALTGYVVARYRPTLLRTPSSHTDDELNPVRLESGLRRRFIRTILVWLIPLTILLLIGGLVAELAGFFTLAALVTFGGAYAVLPFVADAAVDRFGWLTADDMVAGLALGESTPGPLIMVNTFVGFLAGYNVEGGLAWGLAGATIATLCTFAPSFVFIISGAPLIDRVRATGAFASSLNGITIAVVGVIAALGVFVARHAAVVDGQPDWLVVALAVAAFVSVVRFKVDVIGIVASCALVGLIAGTVG